MKCAQNIRFWFSNRCCKITRFMGFAFSGTTVSISFRFAFYTGATSSANIIIIINIVASSSSIGVTVYEIDLFMCLYYTCGAIFSLSHILTQLTLPHNRLIFALLHFFFCFTLQITLRQKQLFPPVRRKNKKKTIFYDLPVKQHKMKS